MKSKLLLLLRILAAAILMQTLYFKFTGAEESKYIFSTLGVEPWGRIFSGIVELAASLLLLLPSTQLIGAFIAANVMIGAILSHVFILGIEVKGDGGLLFSLACVVFICGLLILALQLERVREMQNRLLGMLK